MSDTGVNIASNKGREITFVTHDTCSQGSVNIGILNSLHSLYHTFNTYIQIQRTTKAMMSKRLVVNDNDNVNKSMQMTIRFRVKKL